MTNLDIQYEIKDNSLKSVKVNGFLLHSKYNPKKEAINFIKRHIKQDVFNIIFGYGLGYIEGALKELNFDYEKVLFFDPIEQFSEHSLKGYDVIFTSDLRVMNDCIQKKVSFYSKEINIICAPNYDKLFPNLYAGLLKEIKDVQNLNIIYYNTTHKLSLQWQENSVRNMFYIYEGNSLGKLTKYYHSPVVVASGGPSLTKQLPLLRNIRDNVILIAAGSTIGTLLASNIEPDYVVSIDGSLINYTAHFKNLNLKKTSLIFSATSHFKIQKDFKNHKFAFIEPREEKYQQHIKRLLNIDLPSIEGGGSVANFALSIARYISSGPIAVIGQDLSFTDNKTHADHNKLAKTIDDTYLKENNTFKVEGYFGDKVVTDYPFYSMKTSFENIMLSIEDKDTIFNCTEGGVKIIGMQQLPFSKFIYDFVEKHNEVEIVFPSKNEIEYSKYIALLEEDLKIYTQIGFEYKRANKILEKNRPNNHFTDKTLKTLDSVDENVELLLRKVTMERIIDPITLDIMTKYKAEGEETHLEKYKRVFQQNADLYAKLLEATHTSMNFVRESIEEVKQLEVNK
ncbi:hypothetical protein AEA09_18210 [Lysinibacillus contaminans]|uniref:6-hydroxymethylpterin diphosphokinase MptE-like domain-containing protein n=1 Tax=Lysinibacillus contaminans TaxID=1293441 RepID=A0ABR5JWZ5_9BACI|nr:6-hydroxymethylpterin diphosphokinase MptE-like protein [Lysinibacillus contaminans]KOS66668.1 hypothetical protein AEA09_18210 [Lysinibacillus contaminans]